MEEMKNGFVSGPTLIKGAVFYGSTGEVIKIVMAKKPFLIALPDDEWIDTFGTKEWKEYKENRDNGK